MGWQVLNSNRQTLVAVEVDVANSYVKRFWGLMGKTGLAPHHGLLLVPCYDIHSCFMRFEFDALYIDKQGKVVHMEQSMKPWRFGKIVTSARAVLELPAGTAAATQTEVGDVLEFRHPSLTGSPL